MTWEETAAVSSRPAAGRRLQPLPQPSSALFRLEGKLDSTSAVTGNPWLSRIGRFAGEMFSLSGSSPRAVSTVA